jgi:hypothetical protein
LLAHASLSIRSSVAGFIVSKYFSEFGFTNSPLKEKYDLFINGEFVKPNSEKYFDTINPATDERIESEA